MQTQTESVRGSDNGVDGERAWGNERTETSLNKHGIAVEWNEHFNFLVMPYQPSTAVFLNRKSFVGMQNAIEEAVTSQSCNKS